MYLLILNGCALVADNNKINRDRRVSFLSLKIIVNMSKLLTMYGIVISCTIDE